MSIEEPDGVNEAFKGQLQVALTMAAHVAELAARTQQQRLHEAAADSDAEARIAEARLQADRAAARAALAPVERPEWWSGAEPRDIAQAWQTATTWSQLDPAAAQAAGRIRETVQARYGVDIAALHADPAAAAAALDRAAELDRRARDERGAARRDEAEAAHLLATPAGADVDAARDLDGAGQEPAAAAERGDRRRALAEALEGTADAETVNARLVADANQALPPSAAVATPPARAPRARPARGRGTAAVPQQPLGR